MNIPLRISAIVGNLVESYGGYPNDLIMLKDTKNMVAKGSQHQLRTIIKWLAKIDPKKYPKFDLERFILAYAHYYSVKIKRTSFLNSVLGLLLQDKNEGKLESIGKYSIADLEGFAKVAEASGRAYRLLEYGILGDSTVIKKVRQDCWRSCFGKSLYSALSYPRILRDNNIMLLGESGVGKELFANAVKSARFWNVATQDNKSDPTRSKSETTINIAAMDQQLVSRQSNSDKIA